MRSAIARVTNTAKDRASGVPLQGLRFPAQNPQKSSGRHSVPPVGAVPAGLGLLGEPPAVCRRREHVELAVPEPRLHAHVLRREAPGTRERKIVVDPAAAALPYRLREILESEGIGEAKELLASL